MMPAPPPPTPVPAATKLYVLNHSTFGTGSASNPSVTVYAANASGNATPIATLSGPHTTLAQSYYLAVDRAGTVYVSNAGNSNNGSVAVFPKGVLSGDIAPAFSLPTASAPTGLAVDSVGNLYVGLQDRIVVYGPGLSATSSPIHTIMGSTAFVLSPYELFVGPKDELYEAQRKRIKTYAFGADGNATPINNITGAATQLYSALGVAADSTGKIFVTDVNTNAITTFAATDTGNMPPRSVITNTMFSKPWGIWIDPADNAYLANEGTNAIYFFTSTALAAGVPTTTLSGAMTGLDNPTAVVVR